MFLFLVLVWEVLLGGGSALDERSYRRVDPVTGQTLVCDRCPPGFRLGAHCTSANRTACVPCGAGLFTEFWNYLPECLLCDACADHQRVVRDCGGTSNAACECEDGFYWTQHFCRTHRACKPGHGVKTAGTPYRDTVCELCTDGKFADVTRAHAACENHSKCRTDQQLLLPGSRWHDNLCVTCDEITEQGWVDFFRPVLSGLFIQHRISVHRLQRLVNSLVRKGGGGWRSQRAFVFKSAEELMERLNRWIDQVTAKELPNLLDLMKKQRLEHLADKIERKISRFQMFHHSCNSSVLSV